MKVFTSLCMALLLGLSAFGQTQEKERALGKATPSRILRIYPNPASEAIHFENRQIPQQTLQLRIYNFLGRKMVEVRRVTNPTRVDLTGFGRGLYLYQVVDSRGQIVESGKFQVEK
jgi:hypothetical protein